MWLPKSLFFYLTTLVLSNGIKFDMSESRCSKTHMLESEVVYSYFKNQHSITFIDLSDDRNHFSCSGDQQMFPVRIYTSLATMNLGPRISASSVTSLPTIQGYFLKASSADILQRLLPKVGGYNPRAKVLIRVINQRTPKELKEMVVHVYEEHKILNAAVLILNEQTSSLGSFCFYSPFKQTPSVDCVTFRMKNLVRQLELLETLTAERISNLHKFPLRVHLYAQEMFSKPIFDKNRNLAKFKYSNGAVLEALAEKLNFAPFFINDPFEAFDGFVMPNGTFSGSLAMLEQEEVDYVGNARLISNFKTTKSLFLFPLTMAKYNFIIRRRERTRQLMTFPFEIYDMPTTIISLVLTALFPIIFHAVKICESLMMDTKRLSFSASCLYVTALQWNVSVKLSQVTSVRITTLTIVFYAVIASSLMQGKSVEKLNSSRDFGTIDTVEGLIENGYELVVSHILANVLKKQSDDQTRDTWRNVSLRSVQAREGPNVILKSKNLAFLLPQRHCGNYLEQFYDPQTGENLFEVIDESAFEFYVAAMVPKASPFIEKFNDLILRFNRGGLDEYHLNVAEIDERVIWYQRVKNGFLPKAPESNLKFIELFPAFKLYGICITICCLVFISEKAFGKLTSRKIRMISQKELRRIKNRQSYFY